MALGLLALLAGCADPERREGPLLVFAGVPPHAGVVERLAGDFVQVEVLLPSGRDPHTYEPSPRQVAALAKADLYFRVGTLPFEDRVLGKITGGARALQVVDTSAGMVLEAGDAHAHDHSEGDPHVWLGPEELRVQAGHMAEALAAALPDNAASIRSNLAVFQGELDGIVERIREQLAPFRGRRVFVFHPAFGYFTQAFGLHQEAVEIEGKRPAPKQIEQLIGHAREENVRVIFVQPQFDLGSAEAIARSIDGAVVPVDPMPRDVLAWFEEMAGKIEAALQ